MKSANLSLQLNFDLQLLVPEQLCAEDTERLQAMLSENLGAMVLQGLPTIAGKQLARAGIEVASHSVSLNVRRAAPATNVAREELVMAAPHLTDAELDRLVARAGAALPEAASDRLRALRRHGLAIANEFRLVSCKVHAVTTAEQPCVLVATLNLTNGSVMIEPEDRGKRLRAGQEGVQVEVAGLRLAASYAGHTISGPVIEVAQAEIAAHRDALIEVWQKTNA